MRKPMNFALHREDVADTGSCDEDDGVKNHGNAEENEGAV